MKDTMSGVVMNAMAANRRSREVVVARCPTASKEPVSKDDLLASSQMHIQDVKNAMEVFVERLREAARRHDWTKITFIDAFHRQFAEAQRTGNWGVGQWFDNIHCKRERHHLERGWPKNVNLVDVLEHIADCVVAGIARNGEFKPDMLPAEMLQLAYMNTQKMLSASVKAEGAGSNPDEGSPEGANVSAAGGESAAAEKTHKENDDEEDHEDREAGGEQDRDGE